MVQPPNLQGLKGRTQCGAGGAAEGRATDGELDWASFQNKKDLDEQRFMGFSFSVLVTFQSVERKHAASLHLGDINCIYPKKESRSSQAKIQARLLGLEGNCDWALEP